LGNIYLKIPIFTALNRHVCHWRNQRMSPDEDFRKNLKAHLDAESRKLGGLSPSDLQALLAPWSEPLRQVFGVVQQVQQSWTAWFEQNHAWIAELSQTVRTGAAAVSKLVVEWEAASQRFVATLDEVERLASMGWSVPTQLSVSDLTEFMTLQSADAAADFLISKLEDSDPDFTRMEERLTQDPRLVEFPNVLPQCFRAIRRGDYAIVAPSLVAILERTIQKFNPEHLKASTDVRGTLSKKGQLARKAQEELFCGALWLSLLTVVDGLWKQFPSNMPETPVLSRPAIQHGRVEAPNTKAEIVRLLNTLETSLALHDFLEDSELSNLRRNPSSDREAALFAIIRAGFYLPRGKHDAEDTADRSTSDSAGVSS
jgi:hypothetical protein